MKASLLFKNARKAQEALYEYAREQEANTADRTYEIGEEVLERARELCPKDTGKLASTGRIVFRKRVRRGGFYQVLIRFGGARAHYAVFVHNDPTVQHDNGEDLYLYKAAKENEKYFTDARRGFSYRFR